MTVVTLTSIPPRFDTLGPVLDSLLAQAHRPEAVFLCLPRSYRDFPGPVVPPPLPNGVELIWSDADEGPATKLLPTLRRLRGTGAEIAWCDDDWIYGPRWLELLRAGRRHETEAVAGSAFQVRRLGRRGAAAPFSDIAQGFAGVLIREDMLHDAADDPPAEARGVDDIWFSGHLAHRGIALRPTPAARAECMPLAVAGPSLQQGRNGVSRAEANAACAALIHASYGIWPPLQD